jgi:membrane protease YdiL (CAAX protease family)
VTTVPADEESDSDVRVREAERADLLAVFHIEQEAFPQPWPFSAFERFLDEPGFLVAQVRDDEDSRETATVGDDGRVVGYVVAGVVVAIGLAIGLSALLSALGLLPGSVIGDTAAMNPTYLLGLAALSVLVVAPVEEFVFRGVVQGRLRQRFGPVAAIVGASLLFGSLHLANYSGNPVAIVAGALMIAAIGTVFGTLYERTDNLAVPVLAHAVYNVILLVSSYVAITAG